MKISILQAKIESKLKNQRILFFNRIFRRVISHFNLLEQLETFSEVIETKHKLVFSYDFHLNQKLIHISNSAQKNNIDNMERSVNLEFSKSIHEEEISIVVQGPIVHKNNFTYNSIISYLNYFPNANIILSTWKQEDTITFQDIINDNNIKNLFILKNEMPKYSGTKNINLQITSSYNGIVFAEKLGAKYVLKTRTDQRFNNPLTLQMLSSLYQQYGEKNTANRILVPSIDSFIFRLYGISDMFHFGKVADLLIFWSAKHDNRVQSTLDKLPKITMRKEAEQNICEVYLVTEYMKKLQMNPSFEFVDSLRIVRDLFCIVDSNSFSLIWYKYGHSDNKWKNQYFPHKFHQLSHSEWIFLQQSLDFSLQFEHLLDNMEFNL